MGIALQQLNMHYVPIENQQQLFKVSFHSKIHLTTELCLTVTTSSAIAEKTRVAQAEMSYQKCSHVQSP